MANRQTWQHGYWYLAGTILLGLVGSVLLLNRPEPATAAPHTISNSDHPMDPDWPDVYLLLSKKCVGCHRAGMEQTDLTTYDSLMAAKTEDGAPVVVPGNADDSLFWEQVAWNATAARDSQLPDSPKMPREHHEWLTAGQLAIVRRWINRGAFQYRLPITCSTRPLTELDFPSAQQCAPCHKRQYEQWSRSMHAYAQHSPTFEAFNLTLIERTGGTIGTFCTRCHTPLGTALGENGSRRNVHRSRLSMEGVSCVVCHRRGRGQHKSNGRRVIEPGSLEQGCMYGPFDNTALGPNDKTHPSRSLAYIKTSQFCGECHDVINPSGVRLEEAFSEWLNSPAAKRRISCQHCHMGPVPGVPILDEQRPLGRVAEVPGVDPNRLPLRRLTDHMFAGPDYSLLPDTEFPHKLDWMYEVDYRDQANLTPYQQKTLLDLRRRNRRQLDKAAALRYQLLQNSAKIDVRAPKHCRRGKRITVRGGVTNKVFGHSFPTGFTAERQLWISLTLRDPRGRVIFASGDVDNNGDLRDNHSHAVLSGKTPVDHFLLNFQNKFIALGNKGTERSVNLPVNRHLSPVNVLRPATGISASFGRPSSFRLAQGSMPPLSTMGRTYPISIPNSPGPYRLDVKLNFRHMPPTLLDHIGVPHLKHLLEVVVIDQYETVIHVIP